MLNFDNQWLADDHGPLIVGSPAIPIRRAKYWDVWGEGEVVGQQGGRPIGCTILLHGGYATLKAFQKQVEAMEGKLGVNGTLKETGNLARTYKRVTFEAFEPISLGGEEPGPLPDCGVLTYVNGNGQEVIDGGYFAGYFLRFYQLVVS